MLAKRPAPKMPGKASFLNSLQGRTPQGQQKAGRGRPAGRACRNDNSAPVPVLTKVTVLACHCGTTLVMLLS